MRKQRLVPALFVLFLAADLSGCAVGFQPSGGPSAHAPAHGYRKKNPDNVALVYNTGLGVYVASGYPGIYFHDGYYYRLNGAYWEISTVPSGGSWKRADDRNVPPGLLKQKGKNKVGKAK